MQHLKDALDKYKVEMEDLAGADTELAHHEGDAILGKTLLMLASGYPDLEILEKALRIVEVFQDMDKWYA